MATKPVQMACVMINFDTYLMPADKAMKLVELMQSAVTCTRDFTRGPGYTYTAQEQPQVEFALVPSASIRMPNASVTPATWPRAAPRQLK